MRRVVAWLEFAAGTAPAAAEDGRLQTKAARDMPLWDFYNGVLRHAKYIDLTHAMAPGGPLGERALSTSE